MRQPFLKPPQLELDNKCPDCLYMQLTGSRVQVEQPSQLLVPSLNSQGTSPETEQIDIYLTIRFGEQHEPLANGSVTFGIKSGELKLKIKNGKIPNELQELAGCLEFSLQKERRYQDANLELKSLETPLTNLLFFLAGNKVESDDLGIEPIIDANENIDYTTCQVTIKASEEHPVWSFEENMGESVLVGSLKDARLATLNVIKKPCWVEATFEVSKRDIRLINVEGLWPPNISRNKRAILERLIVLRVLEPKFKPYLSRQELQFDAPTRS